jgi:hypothetical protein
VVVELLILLRHSRETQADLVEELAEKVDLSVLETLPQLRHHKEIMVDKEDNLDTLVVEVVEVLEELVAVNTLHLDLPEQVELEQLVVLMEQAQFMPLAVEEDNIMTIRNHLHLQGQEDLVLVEGEGLEQLQLEVVQLIAEQGVEGLVMVGKEVHSSLLEEDLEVLE